MSLGVVVTLYTCAGLFGLVVIPGVVGIVKVLLRANKASVTNTSFSNPSYKPMAKQKITFSNEVTQSLL